MRLPYLATAILALALCWTASSSVLAENENTDTKDKAKAKPAAAREKEAKSSVESDAASLGEGGSPMGGMAGRALGQMDLPSADKALQGATVIRGLITLYQKEDKLLAEIQPSTLNQDFIVAIAIARGIGQRPLLGGYTWGFGDDWIWQFRKVDRRIQIVRRNVRFTADKGSPTAKAVELGYTDSVLYSLPILAKGPTGGYIVDLGSVFMSDVPQVGRILRGFMFARDKSNWASVKGFKDNVELQVAATYASNGAANLENVPDSRGVTLHIHYSISRMPRTGYRPRLADDRVGYFLTVSKDYSKEGDTDRFVRYVNRWDLQKADPKAAVSPPKRPIIFWLEKTIPYAYRKPIRDGILEWNKAFEKAGFADAIEIRQQPDDATWDPEDINYNTIRWITTSLAFAQGPSRVDPTTGQILDADVIFDADFAETWKMRYRLMKPGDLQASYGATIAALDPDNSGRFTLHHRGARLGEDDLASGLGHELAFGSAVLAARGSAAVSDAEAEKMVMQGLKSIATHEVGHTLGLRHNFKASLLYTLEEMHDTTKTAKTGLGSSVMDYMPINLAPPGVKQGDYFSLTIGPYDYWAIEYGYKPMGPSPEAELPALQKLASRCAEPQFDHADDGDTRDNDPDPLTNRFDMSKDPLAFCKMQAERVAGLWDGLAERVTKKGEGYQHARWAFERLLFEHDRSMQFAARFIGGLYIHRDHKGDPGARPPIVVVEAKRQRDALKLITDEVLGPKAYRFPPELLNRLAAPKWYHWGADIPDRPDYPIHENILALQKARLAQILSPLTLERLIDSEAKVPGDKDAFTAAELFEGVTDAVFAEVKSPAKGQFTNRKPAVASLRRSLQNEYVKRLGQLALGQTGAPDDCRALAADELGRVKDWSVKLLKSKSGLDRYTQAHLRQLVRQIDRVRTAQLEVERP